jgi:hypothetical protein
MLHTQSLTLLIALSFAAGCGGSDDEPRASGNTDLTLEQACSASCDAQVRTKCPNVPRAGECIDGCIEIPGRLPQCDVAWKNLNACMARAPLFCDANGQAAVSSQHCGTELDAMKECMP